MTATVGIDILSSASIEEAIEEHADRYLDRIYTDREQRECGRDPRRLAGCFAGKEAVIKALAPAAGDVVPWNSIGICRDGVALTGAAEALARRRQVGSVSVSISYAGTESVAIAVAAGESA